MIFFSTIARGLIFSSLTNGTLRYVVSKNDTPGTTIEKVIIFPTFLPKKSDILGRTYRLGARPY
jgi:hypothetical protein